MTECQSESLSFPHVKCVKLALFINLFICSLAA